MSDPTVLKPILDANYHKGGLKCQRLFRVEPGFFASLVDEVRQLVEKYTPSAVADGKHVTNWTRPFGTAVQFSLFNRSGQFDDFSTDHSFAMEGKRFHYANEFPHIARFIAAFPYAYNMRLNGMGTKSGLSPHEEHVVFTTGDGGGVQVRGRFHLPLVTSAAAEMLLDGDIYHFEAGSVFFFNNGCIHSATNQGQDFRYHFVWDTAFTQEAYDYMFGGSDASRPAGFLERVPREQAECKLIRRVHTGAYATSGEGLRLYERLKLKYLFVKPHVWQNVYNHFDYRSVTKKPISWWQNTTTGTLLNYGHNAKD